MSKHNKMRVWMNEIVYSIYVQFMNKRMLGSQTINETCQKKGWKLHFETHKE